MEYSIYTEQKYLPNGTIEARILTAAEAERHGYEDGENPIAMKSELITSILEQQMGAGLLTGSQSACKSACDAFAAAVEFVADNPIE